ncbi:MAG: hypothetical protein WHT82_13370, partial [Limisphaera sp.]
WFTNLATLTGAYTDPTPDNARWAVVVLVEPLPLLSVQALPDARIRVSWPVALTNYVLQYRSLVSPGVWSNYPVAPSVGTNERFVIEPIQTNGRMFRLRRQ